MPNGSPLDCYTPQTAFATPRTLTPLAHEHVAPIIFFAGTRPGWVQASGAQSIGFGLALDDLREKRLKSPSSPAGLVLVTFVFHFLRTSDTFLKVDQT